MTWPFDNFALSRREFMPFLALAGLLKFSLVDHPTPQLNDPELNAETLQTAINTLTKKFGSVSHRHHGDQVYPHFPPVAIK